ncbi:MAG: cupin [Ktedonobacterales bacterium]|nr:cupin [Ktedonobacterales bacterium]
MRLFRFDAGVGRTLDAYGSENLILSPIARPAGITQVGCMYLRPGGVVGYHQATMPQLFLVVAGEGWVRGEAPERTPITAGHLAFWQAGEWHEAGSERGMTAIVLEAETLDPARYLTEI